jgi:hypothetical protein
MIDRVFQSVTRMTGKNPIRTRGSRDQDEPVQDACRDAETLSMATAERIPFCSVGIETRANPAEAS